MLQCRPRIVDPIAVVALVACFLALGAYGRVLAGEDGQSKRTSRRPSPFDYAPVYHFRTISYESPNNPVDFDWEYDGPPRIRAVEEGWAVKGVGRRVERREGGELVRLTLDTPRWRFVWYVPRKVVIAYPSRLEDPLHLGDRYLVGSRDYIMRWSERLRATHVSEKDRLDGREVEKVTHRFLAEADGDQNIHDWRPAFDKLLQSPDAVFRTRTHWFDPKTNLPVRRACGCKFPRHDDWIDYPPPESVPPGLFQFEVPRDATLEVNDPELGRRIYSEVQTEPDLRD